MKKNILVTGATGFLGRRMLKELTKINNGAIVGISQSEKRITEVTRQYKNASFYCVDISCDKEQLDHIMKKHNIEYVIHAAAMKHVGICEKNPSRAVAVNVVGSKNIIDLCQNNGIKNLIAISTDKVINPSCIYGVTKYLMEKMILEKGWSIYRGVNFLFSDGSVLDVWRDQMNSLEPIGINTRNTTRFFVDIGDVCTSIINNLDSNKKILIPNQCYKVKLHDLAKAFCQVNNYHNVTDYYDINVEKMVEEIPNGIDVLDTTPTILEGILLEQQKLN
jgi:UDP-N-acetylglucosamine 4,6-dehydratase